MHLPFGCRDAVPRFSAIVAGQLNAMIDDAIEQHSRVIEGIIASPDRSFASVFLRKKQADADWLMVVNSIGHISAVCDTPELRSEYQAVLPRIHAFQTAMSQNAALQDAIEAIRDSNERLSPVDTRAMSLALRDFHPHGSALSEHDRERFRAIMGEIGQLTTDFGNAVMDAAQAWSREISEAELQGIPETVLAILNGDAGRQGKEGWMVSLDQPSVHTILTFAQNGGLRLAVYEARITRARNPRHDRVIAPHGRQVLRCHLAPSATFCRDVTEAVSTRRIGCYHE